MIIKILILSLLLSVLMFFFLCESLLMMLILIEVFFLMMLFTVIFNILPPISYYSFTFLFLIFSVLGASLGLILLSVLIKNYMKKIKTMIL